MRFDFTGRTAVVTGATRGIGESIADDLESLESVDIRKANIQADEIVRRTSTPRKLERFDRLTSRLSLVAV